MPLPQNRDAMMHALREAAAPAEAVLDALRQRFDESLAASQTDDAGDRLRALFRQPAELGGKVKAAAPKAQRAER
jgi:hypothetical protein